MNPITEKDVPQTLQITGSVTSKIITEKDVRDFVTETAMELRGHLKVRDIYLCVNHSIYGGPSTLPCKWTASINCGDQVHAFTLEELEGKLAYAQSAKRAKITALRKEADELEASIAGAKA